MGFSKGWHGCIKGFPEGGAQGKSWGAALTALGKPCHDLFTQFYIIFLICFHIGPPKMHWRFRIVLPKIHRLFPIYLPKMHRQFRIDPPHVFLQLFWAEFHKLGILLTIAIMNEKQQNNLFEISDFLWDKCQSWSGWKEHRLLNNILWSSHKTKNYC